MPTTSSRWRSNGKYAIGCQLWSQSLRRFNSKSNDNVSNDTVVHSNPTDSNDDNGHFNTQHTYLTGNGHIITVNNITSNQTIRNDCINIHPFCTNLLPPTTVLINCGHFKRSHTNTSLSGIFRNDQLNRYGKVSSCTVRNA